MAIAYRAPPPCLSCAVPSARGPVAAASPFLDAPRPQSLLPRRLGGSRGPGARTPSNFSSVPGSRRRRRRLCQSLRVVCVSSDARKPGSLLEKNSFFDVNAKKWVGDMRIWDALDDFDALEVENHVDDVLHHRLVGILWMHKIKMDAIASLSKTPTVLLRGRSNDGAETITASAWDVSVLQSDLPVLVEFWASWCGPCKMVHRLLDEIAREYAGRIKLYKLNTDDHPQVATVHGIDRVPTVLLFKNGEKLKSITGTLPKSVYVEAIEQYDL
ncbi:Thioredoxin [Musa troglodytarum]|uniref:Thioredoxin n=1 Tax=Musa troglodytarum TaxID=320322 RepID=A0A9E7FGF7_9LILI|nr:Thioredoxin [Musa troglodytarum]